jgi:hypothetical protein
MLMSGLRCIPIQINAVTAWTGQPFPICHCLLPARVAQKSIAAKGEAMHRGTRRQATAGAKRPVTAVRAARTDRAMTVEFKSASRGYANGT